MCIFATVSIGFILKSSFAHAFSASFADYSIPKMTSLLATLFIVKQSWVCIYRHSNMTYSIVYEIIFHR